MLDFICMVSAELFGTDRERQIQNENICFQRDSNPRHSTLGESAPYTARPRALMMICGLMSYRILGYLIKTIS